MKERIFERTGIPPKCQKLVFHKKELQDHEVIGDPISYFQEFAWQPRITSVLPNLCSATCSKNEGLPLMKDLLQYVPPEDPAEEATFKRPRLVHDGKNWRPTYGEARKTRNGLF